MSVKALVLDKVPKPMYAMLHLRWGDFDVDDDGGQRCFEELCWMVDSVCIQDDQLKWLSQLKNSLYFTLNLSW